MQRVRPLLVTASDYPTEEIPLELINEWIMDLRGMPYHFSRKWKTLAEVNTAKAGDCKGKAVALYQLMQMNGATGLRLIIGKRRAGDKDSHVWLEWAASEGTYLLDPTFNWFAARTETLHSTRYVPLYAFAGEFKYRAVKMTLVSLN